MAFSTTVIAIRHAPTRAPGVCVGRADVPTTLTSDEAARKILQTIEGDEFESVWTSPVNRCRAPAEIVAATLALPPRVDERLHEISMGVWQGLTFAEIESRDPLRYQAWMRHWQTQAPPDGETPGDLLRRVAAWWDDLPVGRHLLISHAGVHRALRVHVGGKSWEESMSADVPFMGIEPFFHRKR